MITIEFVIIASLGTGLVFGFMLSVLLK